MILRDAKPDEAEAIAQRNIEMARETEGLCLDPQEARRGAAAVLRGEVDARYLIAEVQGEGVGQLMITREWSDWRARWVWWIQSVYVIPAFRGRGVYRAMYAEVCAQARRADVPIIRLYVDLRNTRARQVYSRCGMDGDHYALFEQALPSTDERTLPMRYAPDPGDE